MYGLASLVFVYYQQFLASVAPAFVSIKVLCRIYSSAPIDEKSVTEKLSVGSFVSWHAEFAGYK